MILVVLLVAAVVLAPSHAGGQDVPEGTSDFGVLVMAHGGTPEWDAAIAEATAPLANQVPTAIAYGMADPATLAHALDSLSSEGVERVAVVRMFISGDSFIQQTEYL